MPTETREIVAKVMYYNDDGTEMTDEQRKAYLAEREKELRKREEEHQKRLAEQAYKDSIEGQIESATQAINKAHKNLENLKKIKTLYPDARLYNGRWRKVQRSKIVNGEATEFEYKYSCGCCADAAVQIWPYVDTEAGRVYADPPYFTAGEKSYSGDRPRARWQDDARKMGLTENLIAKIEKRLKLEALEKDDDNWVLEEDERGF